MNENELKRIEQESASLLSLLREVRDEDNATIRTAPCPRPCKRRSLRIRPYWRVAASVLGFMLGMAVPRDTDIAAREYPTLLADTSHTLGRSLAAGDINFALLVK